MATASWQFPVLALVVSGGHTHLYLAEQKSDGWIYHNVGHTRDDAAGEAFDKVAKLLELGYPGGPMIDFLATTRQSAGGEVSLRADEASRPQSAEPSCEDDRRVDFSYSGIKTAVLRYVETHDMRAAIERRRTALDGMPGRRRGEAGACGLRPADARSGGVVSARRGERSGQQNTAGGAGVQCRYASGNGWGCRQFGVARNLPKRERRRRECLFTSRPASSQPTTPR